MNERRILNNEQTLFNLIQLLIDKGVITNQEYQKAIFTGETNKEEKNKPLSKLERMKQGKQTKQDNKPLSKLERMKLKRNKV